MAIVQWYTSLSGGRWYFLWLRSSVSEPVCLLCLSHRQFLEEQLDCLSCVPRFFADMQQQKWSVPSTASNSYYSLPLKNRLTFINTLIWCHYGFFTLLVTTMAHKQSGYLLLPLSDLYQHSNWPLVENDGVISRHTGRANHHHSTQFLWLHQQQRHKWHYLADFQNAHTVTAAETEEEWAQNTKLVK